MAPKWLKKNALKNRDDQRTNAAELTLRQSIYPIILVTVLFFLWGFSYGLLDTLNKHFQNSLNITRARSSGLQAAYFGAYPLASLGHANWILRHYGYKATFIWGLCLYGVGSLVAWPCILYRSFGGFCAAIFIIGNGLGSLETAANPYITAFNGIGTVVAPVIGSYAIFNHVGNDQRALQNVQWIYLAIACFVFLLAVVFYFSPIPEITDADMAFQATETHANADIKPFRKQCRLFHAAFAQFCYTGAQVGIAGFFINYVIDADDKYSDATAAQLLAGAQGGFALGRFIGTFLMRYVRPRWVFIFYLAGCIIFVAPAIRHGGNAGIALLFVTLFFESIIFPTIVALGMRGLGKHSKRGSGWIVGAVCGGAVVPPILGAASDARDSTQFGMVVPLVFFIAAFSYAICVNFVPAYRDVVDAFAETKVGVENVGVAKDEETGSPAGGVLGEKGLGSGEASHDEVREVGKV
ncbi:hypothetical protein MBLNU13_g09562t1 [Cladosporium sp. NU13]